MDLATLKQIEDLKRKADEYRSQRLSRVTKASEAFSETIETDFSTHFETAGFTVSPVPQGIDACYGTLVFALRRSVASESGTTDSFTLSGSPLQEPLEIFVVHEGLPDWSFPTTVTGEQSELEQARRALDFAYRAVDGPPARFKLLLCENSGNTCYTSMADLLNQFLPQS